MAILVSSCASTLPENVERASLQAAEAPKPACESGHEAALNDGVVTIRPGQVVCVQLRVESDAIVPVAIVSESNLDSTLVLKSWIEAASSDTFLTLHNPLDLLLRYEANMVRLNEAQAEYTSSCPVLSLRLSLEHWPYPISELRLSNFSIEPVDAADSPNSMTIHCR